MMNPLDRLIFNRFGLAHMRTLRITPAQVTLICKAEIRVKTHGSGRAGGYAHGAANTQIVVDDNGAELRVATDGLPGARSHARRIRALLARDREVEIL
jgi:hypothetical protein